MPKVTITVDYSQEEFGRGETSVHSRDVDDLDVIDWLWFLIKASEVMGFDVKDLQMITNSGKIHRTDF